MRVKREEMMARRRGRSKSRIKNAQAGSEPASQRASNGKLFLLAVGQLFLGNEIPEEAPTRRRIAKKKKSEEEGRRVGGGGGGGWLYRWASSPLASCNRTTPNQSPDGYHHTPSASHPTL
jgi:hypothetical protein